MFDFAYRSQQTPETSWLSPDGILTLFNVDLVVIGLGRGGCVCAEKMNLTFGGNVGCIWPKLI